VKIDDVEVLDAKRKLVIKISENDVKKGGLRNAKACAAARAIRRIGHFKNARVHLTRTYVQNKHGDWIRYTTPMALRREIIAFDRGGTFEPGIYELQVPSPTQKTGARSYRKTEEQKKRYAEAARARKLKLKPMKHAHKTTAIRDRFTEFEKHK